MIEKRTLTVMVLATLVWALIASSLAAYYYLETSRYQRESEERQQMLLGITEGYKEALKRQDLLQRDYNALLGEYYTFTEENYFILVEKYAQLLSNLGSNYTQTINFSELKKAYESLINATQELKEQEVITRGAFEPLLMEFDELLRSIVAKELENLIGENTSIKVNLCVDYGNGTRTWFNVSASPGESLFDITQQVAQIEYEYYPTMSPGHVLMKTINGVAPSEGKYWFWYYWDSNTNQWVFGQVGCDAWILRDGGTYRWIYKDWGDLQK